MYSKPSKNQRSGINKITQTRKRKKGHHYYSQESHELHSEIKDRTMLKKMERQTRKPKEGYSFKKNYHARTSFYFLKHSQMNTEYELTNKIFLTNKIVSYSHDYLNIQKSRARPKISGNLQCIIKQ